MPKDQEILMALLREAFRQSEPFQSLVHDYSLDVMNDPEVHHCFRTRLNADLPMLRRIDNLKTLLNQSAAGRNGISMTMNQVLEAASALPAASHTNLTEITNLVAVELAYHRMDQKASEALTVADKNPNNTSCQQEP